MSDQADSFEEAFKDVYEIFIALTKSEQSTLPRILYWAKSGSSMSKFDWFITGPAKFRFGSKSRADIEKLTGGLDLFTEVLELAVYQQEICTGLGPSVTGDGELGCYTEVKFA